MKVLQQKPKKNNSLPTYLLIDDDFKPVIIQNKVFNKAKNEIEIKGTKSLIFSQHRLNAMKRAGEPIEIFNEKQVLIVKEDVQKQIEYNQLVDEQKIQINDLKGLINIKNDEISQLADVVCDREKQIVSLNSEINSKNVDVIRLDNLVIDHEKEISKFGQLSGIIKDLKKEIASLKSNKGQIK